VPFVSKSEHFSSSKGQKLIYENAIILYDKQLICSGYRLYLYTKKSKRSNNVLSMLWKKKKSTEMSGAPFLKISARAGIHEHFSINIVIRVA